MKLQMHSVHFDADHKLLDFIQEKANKLDLFYDRITEGEVFLRLNEHMEFERDVHERIKQAMRYSLFELNQFPPYVAFLVDTRFDECDAFYASVVERW